MKFFEIIKDNIILADKAKWYKNFLFKARGLMFTMPLKRGKAIILEADEEGILDTTIHMLFVFFPIDVIWVNLEKKVVDIKRNVLPFTPWLSPKDPAKYVVELPSSSTKFVKVGDSIIFNEA